MCSCILALNCILPVGSVLVSVGTCCDANSQKALGTLYIHNYIPTEILRFNKFCGFYSFM